MDPTTFDRLSRLLATTPARRDIIGGLTGALATLVGRDRSAIDAAAQGRACRPHGKLCFPKRGLTCCHGVCRNNRCRCPRRQRVCRGRCIPKRQCCGNGQCGGGQVCRNGRCRCSLGKRRCGTRCIARGACCRDGECGTGERCVQGRCRCAPGFKPCQGACILQAACCTIADCGQNQECAGHACRCNSGFKPCQGGCIPTTACCGGCAPDQNCINGTCEAIPCGQDGPPCRVFVTSTTYQGDLREGGQGSGIDGADAKCQARAQVAGLSGTYKAWLSGSSDATSPSERFTNTEQTGPYVLLDANATVIAANWADLTDGTLQNPINVTELGDTRDVNVWTHTLADGTPGGTLNVHCQEWTTADPDGDDFGDGGINYQNSVEDFWTANFSARCTIENPLYCFEQG